MEFLAYDNGDSSASDSDTGRDTFTKSAEILTENPPPVVNKPSFTWQETDSDTSEASDDDDGEATRAAAQKQSTPAGSVLPSALNLLDGTSAGGGESAPSFLQHCYVEPVTLKEKRLESISSHNSPSTKKESLAATKQRPTTSGLVVSSSSSAASNQNKRKAAASGSEVSARLTGKERVKNQRLCGQSGIGTDFKTWKSEEEMRLRQTFD